jgi:hypothetical protein
MPVTTFNPGRDPIPVRGIPKVLGIDVCIETIGRWISRGVNGVRLRATKIGGRVYVLPEDLDAFVRALNAIDDREPIRVRPTRRPVSQAQADSVPQEVEAKLDAIFGTRQQKRKAKQEGGAPAKTQ